MKRPQGAESPAHLALQSVTPVVTDGYHNAFTSLCQWRGHTYVAYRQGHTHNIHPPGSVKILRSLDLATWEPVGELATGGDDRDPHLVPMADRLCCLWGTYVPAYDPWVRRPTTRGEEIVTHAAWSYDGRAWGAPYRVCRPGSWLWNCLPPHHTGRRAHAKEGATRAIAELWCGISYDIGDGVVDQMHTLTLWVGRSPMTWQRWAVVLDACERFADWHPSEPVLFRLDRETLACLVRLEDGVTGYGTAMSPYTQWEWQALRPEIHAPAVLEVPGFGWVVAGREYEAGKHRRDKPKRCAMTLWQLLPQGENAPTLHRLLTLPSAGDCSYPGLVWDSGREALLCSYYSQHERPDDWHTMPVAADVFLARLTLHTPEGLPS